MLWYKAWLETRSRFLISLGGIVALSSYIVFHEDHSGGPYPPQWFARSLHTGHVLLATMWALAVTLLMMGGLVREKAVGAASFTLALPVSRARLMRIRILAGLVEGMALILIPWSVMYVVSAVSGGATSLYQAFFHVVLLAGGGLVFFAVALLVSSLVEGEYTAPAVSFGIVVVATVALGDRPLSDYNPWYFILGSEYLSRNTALLTGPIPWMHVAASVLLAALLAAISIKVIERREF